MTSVRAFGRPQKLNRMQQISTQANGTSISMAYGYPYIALSFKKLRCNT